MEPVTEQVCVDGGQFLNGTVRITFVKSEFIGERFPSNSGDVIGTLNTNRASRTRSCVLRDQNSFAGQKFEALKKLLCSFLHTAKKSDGSGEVGARKGSALLC